MISCPGPSENRQDVKGSSFVFPTYPTNTKKQIPLQKYTDVQKQYKKRDRDADTNTKT